MLFTDTLSVLQALKGMRKPTQLLLKMWKLLPEINAELRWTRAHVGTEANELGKKAAAGEDDSVRMAYMFASEKTAKSAIVIES
ncbi:hypothetical protein Trydic_g22883 [Trypoxylus dichotomus]